MDTMIKYLFLCIIFTIFTIFNTSIVYSAPPHIAPSHTLSNRISTTQKFGSTTLTIRSGHPTQKVIGNRVYDGKLTGTITKLGNVTTTRWSDGTKITEQPFGGYTKVTESKNGKTTKGYIRSFGNTTINKQNLYSSRSYNLGNSVISTDWLNQQ